MEGPRRFVWQLTATFGYCVLLVLIGAVAELTLTELLIPAAVLTAYALSAQAFPTPWRYWLAAGPWLLVLAWLLYVSEGSFDCGADCDGTSIGGVLLAVGGFAFIAVVVAGPALAVARWWRRR